MNRYREKAIRLIAEGADPRRADPAAAERFGVPPSIGARLAFALGMLSGALVVAAVGLIAAVFFDWRPATPMDVALAQTVRSAIPDLEAVSLGELRARLRVPAEVSASLAPLFEDLPPESTTMGPAPLRSLTADRVTMLREIATNVETLSFRERSSAIPDLLRMEHARRDPTTWRVLQAVAAIPSDDRKRLAENELFPRALAELAALDTIQMQAVLAVGMSSITGNPERIELLQSLPRLDLSETSLLLAWQHADEHQRSALIYILFKLANDDLGLGRLLSAFWAGNPGLYKAIAALPPLCSFKNAGACR